MYSLASRGVQATFKVENTFQMRKNKIHSQFVCGIICDTKLEYIPSTYGNTDYCMYLLASCGMYATFEVENTPQIKRKNTFTMCM